MRPIKKSVKKLLEQDPFMTTCFCVLPPEGEDTEVRHSGRVEWDHRFFYAGRQIDERFAIIGRCVLHHRGSTISARDNRLGEFLCLLRATPEELARYPKIDWDQIWRPLHIEFHKMLEHFYLKAMERQAPYELFQVYGRPKTNR